MMLEIDGEFFEDLVKDLIFRRPLPLLNCRCVVCPKFATGDIMTKALEGEIKAYRRVGIVLRDNGVTK